MYEYKLPPPHTHTHTHTHTHKHDLTDVNDDLADVIEVLDPLASSWKEIGTRLRIPADKMDVIASDNPQDVKDCLREVAKEWLRRNYDTKFGEPSWMLLAKACFGINGVVFKDIAESHKGKYYCILCCLLLRMQVFITM